MVNWIILAVFGLLLVIIFIKFEHQAKRIKLILLLLFIAFIYFSASSVLEKNEVKLNSFQGWTNAGGLYFSWLGNAAANLWHAGGDIKTTVGNAIKTNSSASQEDEWKINIRK